MKSIINYHRSFSVALAFLIVMLTFSEPLIAKDHHGITSETGGAERFPLIVAGVPTAILCDTADNPAVLNAVGHLLDDFERVSGGRPVMNPDVVSRQVIIIGGPDSKLIKELERKKKIDKKELDGKTEKYLMATVDAPLPGVDKGLVIAGSDRRGAVYGIYELSEQIGVSPWYDWADVPDQHHSDLYIKDGAYTAGEPAVRYRGIFLNDEAPCLTGWVKETYGTEYGGHDFYARVFELLLRLRGNYMWPAMWGWSFYADDPLNISTANEMGVIMGTSHHEPMARNHQEWARHRDEYGAWDYASNQETIDNFFREGMRRAASTEDIITIGMRGDGDAPMGGEEGKDHEYVSQDEYNMALLRKIFANQRRIIREETGENPEKRPQMWAMYKEVLKYYDLGLRVPDDVTMLLCDDNWGNVRRLPTPAERDRKGGWGMYYHVDYVGAPRNTKWLNVTPVRNMWEQLKLTYDYGVDRIWILNVGDLKPMEYPIDLFLNMAWNPGKFDLAEVDRHLRDFCSVAFGEKDGEEAARILDLQCKYAGRVTPEMLDADTYNLAGGEWRQVADEYARLEAEALRLFIKLPEKYRDSYRQLVLFPVQAMSNLYEMYYSQAMNRRLAEAGDPEANRWADNVEKCFSRDRELCAHYNHEISGGKWNHMMDQKHIGYTGWNDNFPADKMPETIRIDDRCGGYVFTEADGKIVAEARHYYSVKAPEGASWTFIPGMGRTDGAMSLFPYTASTSGASISYKMKLAERRDSVDVHIVLKSNLAFAAPGGHHLEVKFEGAEGKDINVNRNLNDDIYSVLSHCGEKSECD